MLPLTDENNTEAYTMTNLTLGSNTNLYVDYIYLDTAERQRFPSQSRISYRQLQF